MALVCFYDTETTGLPRDDLPLNHPDQPHLVQVAALLVDTETRVVVSSIDLLVCPEDWEIPQEVTDIHGITTEQAKAAGVDESDVVMLLCALSMRRLRIGHHEAFDSHIIRIALARHTLSIYTQQDWAEQLACCTMTAATPIMQLPASQRMIDAGQGDQYKSPRLSEAYTYFTGLQLQGAHNAKNDARATMEIYFGLQDLHPAP